MPTINEVLERVNRARPDALDDKTKAGWLIELDGKLYREVILRHRLTSGQGLKGPSGYCSNCGSVDIRYDREMDASHCEACGWSDMPELVKQFPEDGDRQLLVGLPYDNLYDLYVMAQADFYNRESENYNNSALAFNTALDEYKKDYHRTHDPIGRSGSRNLF